MPNFETLKEVLLTSIHCTNEWIPLFAWPHVCDN